MFSVNAQLPELPVWQARSFYAQLLLAVSVILNVFGIDLFAALAEIGLGGSPEEVIDTGVSAWQAIAPLVFGLWAWLERRAPNYRLVGVSYLLGRIFPAVLLAMVLLIPPPAAAQVICGDRTRLTAQLLERHGERPVGAGLARDAVVELLLSIDGSWTILLSRPDGRSCIVATGGGWQDLLAPTPRGDPA